MYIPPPLLAVFPVKVLFVTVGEEEVRLIIPPPPKVAEFPEKVLFATVGEDEKLYIPPPSPAEFPEKVQFVTVGEEKKLNIPPPLPLVEFPEKVQFVTVGEEEEELNIPPPERLGLKRDPDVTSAFPPVMVKPSISAVALVPEPVTTV